MLQLKPEGLDLADVASRPVAICGRSFIADSSGALYWPGERALLVADLSLEGAGVRQTLTRLAEVMDRYEPAAVIALGDGAHADGAAAMTAEDQQVLRILQEERDWIWVTGLAQRGTRPELGGRVLGTLSKAGIAL